VVRDNPFRIGRSKRYIGLVLGRTYRKVYRVVVYYPCMEEFERVVSRRSCEFSAPAGLTTTAISVLKFGSNITPEFQNTYGSSGETSWGTKLATPSTYDPLKFFHTGVVHNNAVDFSIGSAQNQTYVSFASTDSKGIIPNHPPAVGGSDTKGGGG